MDGISQMMSPKEIITGFRVNFLQHCKLKFGDYVQTHEEHTNDMTSHMIGTLSLWPTGNSQGGYYCYSLTTGHVIAQQRYTILPMPCEVIEHIHHKAWQENASTGVSILNCWREDILDEPVYPNDSFDPVEDDNTLDDDSLYHPQEEDGSSSPPHEPDSESVAPIEASLVEPDPIEVIQTEGVEHHPQPDTIEPDDETVVTQPEVMHAEESDLFVPVEAPANPVITPHLSQAMQRLEIDDMVPPILEACTWSGKVLSTVADFQVAQDEFQQALIGIVMTQYHVPKGLKVFGEAGAVGVRKELQQLHDCKIPKPIHPEGLSNEQFANILEYLMFLKEK